MTEIIGAPTLDDALQCLAARIAEAESRGEKNLIFCEDRLSLLAERAVLQATDGATFLSEVTTFARFLSGGGKTLSKQGSVMAISAIIEEEKDALSCFNATCAQAAYETIAQLSASRVDDETLLAGAGETEGALRQKLTDLALLLKRYREFLESRSLTDENGYLAYLPQKIASGVLAETNVYFFAFPSFTAQAREGVRAAILNAKSVTGIFIAGREEFYTNEAARVFRATAEELTECKLYQLKSSQNRESLLLAQRLFAPSKYALPPEKTEHVHMFCALDENDEMNTVCSLIKERIRAGLRFRDIAVLVDGDDFSAAEKAFLQFGIPYFADRKRTLSEHPFCRFVLSVLEGASNGILPGSADAVISSVYFGDGDAYRNYLLRYGCYRGAVKKEIREETQFAIDRESLCRCREKLLGIFALFPRKGTGEKYVQAVRKLRDLVEEKEITERLSAHFTGAEKEFLTSTALDGVLEEIALVAGERTFTAREFLSLLQSGLQALSVAMLPQSADAVFLGDLTESKFSRVKVLFCTGLSDAVPRVSQDTAVITDGEITKLKTLQVEIEPAIRIVNARARESLALNLCSFSDEVFFSYAVRKGGKEQNRSEALSYIERTFQTLPMSDIFPLNCCEETPAKLLMYSLKDDFESGREEDERKLSSLWAVLGGDFFQKEETAVPAAGELWFSGDVSPTLLESYFTCPYRGFAERGLKLRERQEGAVPDNDAGNFVHTVLETAAAEFNAVSGEEELRRRAEEIARMLLETSKYSQLSDTGAGRYAGKRLISESVEASCAAYRQVAGSSFRVSDTEKKLSLPQLQLSGRADRVDKAGEFVRVVDYKTGKVDDKPVSYYTGRKLQLQLYLYAAAREGKAVGAFYFPAADTFSKPDDVRYRLKGFFSSDEEALYSMDEALRSGGKSLLFEGGGKTERGMSQEEFEDFLSYSLLVSARAEEEMRAGNVAPSPYGETCSWCAYRGMCGFVGAPRTESGVKCAEIARIVRANRGEA